MKEHMKLLGFKVRDVVTGFTGVVESISFDLYGCVQAIVKPAADGKGNHRDGLWFDVARLRKIGSAAVMRVPPFTVVSEAVHGPSEKPAFPSTPIR